jgi:hypothetical protein
MPRIRHDPEQLADPAAVPVLFTVLFIRLAGGALVPGGCWAIPPATAEQPAASAPVGVPVSLLVLAALPIAVEAASLAVGAPARPYPVEE